MNNILETKGKKFLKLFLLALVTILTVNIGGAFLVTAKAATNDTKTTKEMEQTSSASTYSMVDKKAQVIACSQRINQPLHMHLLFL